jgi:hypothetical protein
VRSKPCVGSSRFGALRREFFYTKMISEVSMSHTKDKVMWINHLCLLPGDPSVTTSFDSVSSGVGGGLSGLIIRSNTVGEYGLNGGKKQVETALEIPPGFTLKGVRICYELSNKTSYFNQIRLQQVQDPPSNSHLLLTDSTQHTDIGPICVNSTPTLIDPSQGPVFT